MPDSPTLRELVDMLPEDIRICLGVQPDDASELWWCVSADGLDSILIGWGRASDMIFGYLVRWLGESPRNLIVRPLPWGMWDVSDHYGNRITTDEYPTPIEAAVRAVGVVWKQ